MCGINRLRESAGIPRRMRLVTRGGICLDRSSGPTNVETALNKLGSARS
jgi:hypothetical protein